jgi:putative transposase
MVRELCDMPRHRTYGYRRIWALLRRKGHKINREIVRRMRRQMGLSRPKIWHKPKRPKRVEKMHPVAPNRGWQIDMTSFPLSDLTSLCLMMVTDCCSRKIVGWTLDRRCRVDEWISALRMGLDSEGLTTK